MVDMCSISASRSSPEKNIRGDRALHVFHYSTHTNTLASLVGYPVASPPAPWPDFDPRSEPMPAGSGSVSTGGLLGTMTPAPTGNWSKAFSKSTQRHSLRLNPPICPFHLHRKWPHISCQKRHDAGSDSARHAASGTWSRRHATRLRAQHGRFKTDG